MQIVADTIASLATTVEPTDEAIHDTYTLDDLHLDDPNYTQPTERRKHAAFLMKSYLLPDSSPCCIFDSNRGIYMGEAIQDLALRFGWTGEDWSAHEAEDETYNAEQYQWATDEADAYLCNLCPEGITFFYGEGAPDYMLGAQPEDDPDVSHLTPREAYHEGRLDAEDNDSPDSRWYYPDGTSKIVARFSTD